MLRRRLRVLVAKTPVVGIGLSVATLYGLWLVATATTVPELVSAPASPTDDGLFVADFPATLEASTERVSIVDGNGRRREARLFRREPARSLRDTEDHENGAWGSARWPPFPDQGTAVGIRVWVRPSGRVGTPEATMEITVSERSLLSYAVTVLFRRER